MPITVRWDDKEPQIILLTLDAPYTWHEYDMAIDNMAALARSVQTRVDAIFWNRTNMPQGNPLPHLKRTLLVIRDLENLHLRVTVDPGYLTFARVMLETLRPIHTPQLPDRAFFVSTIHEAYRLICEHRTKDVRC